MKVNFENIYEHIGHLFYGLVFEREEPPTAEVVKLTELIERIWKPLTGGDSSLHLHLVDCIHEGVRYAIENGMSSEEALSSFSNYYQIHSSAFSQALKEKIMTTVVAIVDELSRDSSDALNKVTLAQLLKLNAPAL